MGLRVCRCCEKWWDVETGKEPGLYRKRARDGVIHEFIVYMPPRARWKQKDQYCIICMMVTPSYKGPITGKWHKNCC